MGGLLGAGLAASGQDVTLLDTGAHLAALRKYGLRLRGPDGLESVTNKARATDSFKEAGPQDVVFLALKAYQIRDVAAEMPVLFQPDTFVVTLQNGIPWWYFQRHGGKNEGRRLDSLDPDGAIESGIPVKRIIGCVAYASGEKVEPGVIRHVEGRRFPVGEPDGSISDRCLRLVKVLTNAGFKSYILENIRSEIWLKALGNLCFNPISALTHATMVDICRFPETRDLASRMMQEAWKTAEKLDIRIRHTIEKRLVGAEGVGAHRTSMLQDVTAGQLLETEALIGAVLELARVTETPAPSSKAVYACVRLLARTYLKAGARVDLIPLKKPASGG